jgi:hypothetical protein
VISGFGFNDDHISKPIMAAIEANMSLRVVVCDVAFLGDGDLERGDHVIAANAPMRADNPYFTRFKELVAAGDQRITLINGRFEDLAHALPDLVATTERERHTDRFHTVREADTGGGTPP